MKLETIIYRLKKVTTIIIFIFLKKLINVFNLNNLFK